MKAKAIRRRTTLSRRRKWAFRLAALAMGPVLCLLLPELALRLFNYGYPTDFFLKIEGRDAYSTNPRFGWRFFPPAIARTPQVCNMPADKPPNTYRIFVLGSSAAWGVPAPEFNFGRILKVMLQEQYPGTAFEVINAAVTAINSHAVLPIARDCAKHDPDLFIVYMGNNEVIGPYGPGTVFQQHCPSLRLIRASIAAKATRLGQLVEDLLGRIGDRQEKLTHWRGMEMFLDKLVPADSPLLENTYRNFQRNLTDICNAATGAGVKAIVCTVASNLKDSPPFASLHRADLTGDEKARWEQLYNAGIRLEEQKQHAEAAETYLRALVIDDRFADLHFRRARCLLAIGQLKDAHQHYVQARDMDALRFRADTKINNIIREVARGKEAQGLYLIDAVEAFQHDQTSPGGIPGEALFYEHVHMRFAGNYLLARVILQKMASILPRPTAEHLSTRPTPPTPPTPHRCAELLALTRWNQLQMEEEMCEMLFHPPFTSQLDCSEKRTARQEYLAKVRKERASTEMRTDALQACLKAVERAPDDLDLRYNLTLLLRELGQYAAAEEQARILLEAVPTCEAWHTVLAVALAGQNKFTEAQEHFQRAITINPAFAPAYNEWGLVLHNRQDHLGAVEHYREAVRLRPNITHFLTNLGNALVDAGEPDEAEKQFRKVLEINPRNLDAYNGLGNTLADRNPLDQAVEMYRRALEIDPESILVLTNLGGVLVKQNDVDAALEVYEKMVRLQPATVEIPIRLALMLAGRGRYDKAIAAFRMVTRNAPQAAQAANNLAWLLATAPDAGLRNGQEAIQIAERLCQQANRTHPGFLDTLAAAYAETRQFDKAIAAVRQALEIVLAAGDQEQGKEMQARLELYQQGIPYREPDRLSPASTSP